MAEKAHTRHSPVADGFVHQFCCNGTIHSTADGTYYSALGATDFSYAGDLLANEGFL